MQRRLSLCLVTSVYAPAGAIGGRRCERLALHLHDNGWDVTVVCPSRRWLERVDDTIEPPPGPEVIYTRALLPRPLLRDLAGRLSARRGPAPPGPAGGERTARDARRRPGVRSLLMKGLRGLAAEALDLHDLPDEYAGWIPFAVRAVSGRRFDVVLGSVPYFSAAEAARRIALRSGAQLVLDYRDPWSDQLSRLADAPPRRHMRRHWRQEGLCLRQAALVVGVTRTICSWLAPRCTRPPELVPNGYTPPADDRADRGPRGADAPLVYAGSLAYGRTLKPLLRAMARLRDEGGPALRLDYIGGHGDAAAADAVEVGAADLLRVLGTRPLPEALEAYAAAAAAVVVVSEEWEYALPGKIFEILGCGTPMLLVAAPGCEADLFVKEHKLGWSNDPGDIAGLTDALRALAAGDVPTPCDLEEVTAEATSARYGSLLRGLVDHPRP